MFLAALLIFSFDFLTEVAAVYWVWSVNERQVRMAVLFTVLSVFLTRSALYLVVVSLVTEDVSLLVIGGVGEILGTMVAMWMGARQKDVGKVKKDARNWVTHRVLRRPVPKRRRRIKKGGE